MNATSDPAPVDDGVPYIAHAEFRSGLPHGRFRVVVDPARARPYVMQRLRMQAVAIALTGLGAALALSGQPWPGVALVAIGVIVNRVVKRQAPKILLHLALNDAAVYRDVTENAIMEVRRS
jgi:hypothetical protein